MCVLRSSVFTFPCIQSSLEFESMSYFLLLCVGAFTVKAVGGGTASYLPGCNSRNVFSDEPGSLQSDNIVAMICENDRGKPVATASTSLWYLYWVTQKVHSCLRMAYPSLLHKISRCVIPCCHAVTRWQWRCLSMILHPWKHQYRTYPFISLEYSYEMKFLRENQVYRWYVFNVSWRCLAVPGNCPCC
jgi:hypothetical protein